MIFCHSCINEMGFSALCFLNEAFYVALSLHYIYSLFLLPDSSEIKAFLCSSLCHSAAVMLSLDSIL